MIVQQTSTIDTDTGEELGNKKRKIEIFNEEGLLFWANKYFVKQFSEISLSEHIGTGEDFRRVHILAEKIYKSTNTISVRESTRKVRPADIEDISKMVKLNIRRTKEFLNRMILKQVIAVRIDKVGDIVSEKYVLNPIFFFSAKRLSPDLYFLFQESLDCYLHPKSRQFFHDMGNIKDDIQKSVKKPNKRITNPLKERVNQVLTTGR